jgi:hypothetical protein
MSPEYIKDNQMTHKHMSAVKQSNTKSHPATPTTPNQSNTQTTESTKDQDDREDNNFNNLDLINPTELRFYTTSQHHW